MNDRAPVIHIRTRDRLDDPLVPASERFGPDIAEHLKREIAATERHLDYLHHELALTAVAQVVAFQVISDIDTRPR